jgi:hypothetical protein
MFRAVTATAFRVADGPVNGTGWYLLDDAPRELIAPGGVVLCDDATTTPHAGAGSAAQSAWALLRSHQAATTAAPLSEPLSGRYT